jgi:membrane-associated phospholipid phosphatase
MWLLTQLGNGLTSLLMGGVFYLAGLRKLAVELILGTLTLWLVVEALKAFTDRARPFVLLEDARVIGWREPGLSFPSGHTSQVFFIATFLTRYFEFNAWAIFGLYGLAVLVGLTRMYVGAHYPRDVLAGALLGGVWGLLMMLVDVYFVGRGV